MSRLLGKISLLIAALGVGAGCGPPADAPINVVLISIDTLRPDHLGCYGYERPTSPAIDRLAREGVLFTEAVSTTTWTLPAHHALLTALPNQAHRVRLETDRLHSRRVTLAERFQESGYRTGGVFTAPFLLPRFGFAQGFDDYMDATIYDKSLIGWDELFAGEQGRTTPGAMDKVEAWLDREPGKPFFLFLHLFDPHADFDPPPPYDTKFDPDYEGTISGKHVIRNPAIRPDMSRRDLEHLIALYDGEIRFVDDEGVGRMLRILEDRRLIDRTLVVLTSDHGEEFYEHGQFGHHANLYDTTLRIPLLFRLPSRLPRGATIDKMARIIDIGPTILEVAGLPPTPEGLGQSLLPLIDGNAEAPRQALIELTHSRYRMEGLRTDDHKLIVRRLRGMMHVFDLADDPGERRGMLNAADPAVTAIVEDFERKLRIANRHAESLEWGDLPPDDLDEETRQRLRSLGYLQQ